jgi:hypothetical protein
MMIRSAMLERIARLISPHDWAAFDQLSTEDYRFVGLSIEPSLDKADKIIAMIEEDRAGRLY